jgi:hypothetical protein
MTRHRAQVVVAILVVVLGFYLWLLADRAVAMIVTGEPVAIGLGVGIFLLPVIGVLLIAWELRFGWRTEQLGQRLTREGGLPQVQDLARRPSGRVDRGAADDYFETVKQQVEAAPEDWRAWFRLSVAYDLAGDRKRARSAMRRSIELETADQGPAAAS